MTTTLHSLDDIARRGFEEGHGYKPYEWQTGYISHILSSEGAAIIVRGTGGGKSAVRNTLQRHAAPPV